MKRKNLERSPNVKQNRSKSFKFLFEEEEDENLEEKSNQVNTNSARKSGNSKEKQKNSKRSSSKSPEYKPTTVKAKGGNNTVANSKPEANKAEINITATLDAMFMNMQKGNLNKPEKRQKETYTAFDYLPYDHSISTMVEIKVPIENSTSRQDIINLIINFFTENVFSYYQFTHAAAQKTGALMNRDYIYERNLKDHKSQNIDYNYIEAMPKILSTFIDHKENKNLNFFYIVTKLFSMYYFMQNDASKPLWKGKSGTLTKSGLIITNYQAAFEKKLKDNGILYDVLNKPKYNTKSSDSGEDSYNKLLYISGYYQVLFYNFFLNDYENNSFDIYSSFAFNGGYFKQNKIQIDKIEINDKMELTFTLYGCIFHKEIKFITDFLKQRVDVFYINYTHLSNTTLNHVYHDNLKHSIKRVEFKDNKYYIYY
jgi:hypothetical protein